MNMLGLLPKLRNLTPQEIAHIGYWIASWEKPELIFDTKTVQSLTDLALYDCSTLLKMAEHYFRLYEADFDVSFSRPAYEKIKKLVEECSGNCGK